VVEVIEVNTNQEVIKEEEEVAEVDVAEEEASTETAKTMMVSLW